MHSISIDKYEFGEDNFGIENHIAWLHVIIAVIIVNIHFASSQHPESNGIIEWFHSTLVEHLRIFDRLNEFKKELVEQVLYGIFAYNSLCN